MRVPPVEINTEHKNQNNGKGNPILMRLKFFGPLKHEIKLRKYFNSPFYFARFSIFIPVLWRKF